MPRVDARLAAGQTDVPAAHGHKETPCDFPARLLFNRVYGEFPGTETVPPANGLLGWTLDIFALTVDNVHVRIKFSRDPRAVVVEVDGEPVHKYVINRDGDPEVTPGKLWREMQAERDGRFVELNELQPGDFVEEDDDGNVVITRNEELNLDELPGMWDKSDLIGGREEVRGPDWTPDEDDEIILDDDDDELIIDDEEDDDIDWE